MIKVIQLTEEEYKELLSKTNQPSELLQLTNANLKEKLDKATKMVSALEEELAMFSMSSRSTKQEVPITQALNLFDMDVVIVHTYNAMVVKDYQGITETVNATVESLKEQYPEVDGTLVKQTIKKLVEEGLIIRDNKKNRKIKQGI